MEYFSKVIPMNLLKNHISNDPIIDFFQIQNIKSTIYNEDTNNYFKRYIIKETIAYKQNFFAKFKDKINSLHPINNLYDQLGVNETIHLIKKNNYIKGTDRHGSILHFICKKRYYDFIKSLFFYVFSPHCN